MADTASPLVRRRASVGVAIETTSGTSVFASITGPLTSTDVFDASCEPVDLFAQTERRPLGQYNGQVRAPVGQKIGRFRFTINLCHACALLSNEIIIRMAGFANSSGYKPVTSFATRPKTFSMKFQQDGREHRLYGCVADVTFEFVQGAAAKATFEGMGVWDSTSDQTLFTQSIPSTLPYTASNMAVTVNSAEVGAMDRVTIRLGNVIAPRQDVTAAAGVHYFYVAERSPSITLEPEARLVATNDHFGSLLAATEHAINIELDNGTNTIDFDAPKAQRRSITYAERENRHVDVLEFACNSNSGDDELSIAAA